MGEHYIARRSVVTALVVIVVALLAIGGANWWLYHDKPGRDLESSKSTAEESSANMDTSPTRLQLYFVALDDKGVSGQKIGCDDSLIQTEIEASQAPDKLRTAFERLLSSHEQTYGESGLYNALYQSRLKYVDGDTKGDTVTVKLSGKVTQGGTCDTPRIKAQLRATAKAATGASKTKIYINGKSLDKALN